MKALIFLFAFVLLCPFVLADTRVIRTYKPIPYQYNHYNRPHCYNCGRGYYNNSYRPYHKAHRHYRHNYNNAKYSTRRNIFNSIFNGRNYNNYSSPTERALERFRSNLDKNIVPIADIKPLKSNDIRLFDIEKNIFGKTYQHQDLSLRLNRLEKSMFNKTYTKKNADERIDNLYSCYKKQLNEVSSHLISDLEKCVWGRSYGNEQTKTRIEKLEQEVLGAIQEGDLSNRLKMLENVISSSDLSPESSAYGTCYGGYLPPEEDFSVMGNNSGYNGGFGGFMNNLGLIFGGGCPTGWSPQLTPYGHGGSFGTVNSGDYEGYVGDTGYAYQNKLRGTGTGVHILD